MSFLGKIGESVKSYTSLVGKLMSPNSETRCSTHNNNEESTKWNNGRLDATSKEENGTINDIATGVKRTTAEAAGLAFNVGISPLSIIARVGRYVGDALRFVPRVGLIAADIAVEKTFGKLSQITQSTKVKSANVLGTTPPGPATEPGLIKRTTSAITSKIARALRINTPNPATA